MNNLFEKFPSLLCWRGCFITGWLITSVRVGALHLDLQSWVIFLYWSYTEQQNVSIVSGKSKQDLWFCRGFVSINKHLRPALVSAVSDFFFFFPPLTTPSPLTLTENNLNNSLQRVRIMSNKALTQENAEKWHQFLARWMQKKPGTSSKTWTQPELFYVWPIMSF